MSKGDETREAILKQAALLFNRRGYFGAAMSDVMEVTGLEKGGIYNHFKSKEDLALQAFDYAVDLVRREIGKAARENRNTVDRLHGMVAVFHRQAEGYPLAGGCPVMNTAIESDNAHPALRERARKVMDEWHDFVRRTVRRGQDLGEIRAEVDGRILSTLLIAALEGALMQSMLYGSIEPMERTANYLNAYLDEQVRLNPA